MKSSLVVDDVVCAERPDHLHVPVAALAGHLGVEGPGDLHGEVSHTSRGSDDQNLLPWRDPSVITQPLQGRRGGQGHGSSLLEREGGRFGCQEVFRDTYVLGEYAKAVHERAPEHIIAGPEHLDGLANRFDLSCHVATQYPDFRFA